MRIAVIPARGQSKRIPRKNIKEFCGKPIIAWSIEAAIQSQLFNDIIVSTDDAEIAKVAHSFGAHVPFERPADLSDDYTSVIPVVAHAIGQQIQNGCKLADVCCILPTAPFISPEDLAEGARRLENEKCDYVFALTDYGFPIQRSVRLLDGGRVEMFWPENFGVRSQDLETAYHDAGQFYWGRAEAWLAMVPIFSDNSVGLVLPRYRVQDIDTSEDWLRAEHMFMSLRKENLDERAG